MKSERLKRTKAVMASVAIALVVAALAFGISSSVLGPKSAIARHLGFDLTSGSSSFTITSSIYPSPACSGSPALLYPATTRCMVFSVHNNLKATISVQSITTSLDPTALPAPPADCAGTNLELPTFSGSFNVVGGGNATSPGVPIELKDNGSPQNDCENYTYNFVYNGNAIYTEVYGTTTGLTSSQNPSTLGQSVTYTATLSASATASQDPVPSSPTGTVTFKDNGTTICAAPVPLTSTGTTTATAQCTVNYATTAGSPHPITASYTNTDGNFTNSSGSLSQVVNSPSIGTTSSLTSTPNPSSFGSSVSFTDTVSASSGTPAGTVTFYSCTTSACSTKTALGASVTLSGGKATFSTSNLAVGTNYVEALYAASGNYAASTSNVVSQVVNALGTTSSLTSTPNPSSFGSSVSFTDTVSASSGTPAGTVTFYSCTTSACSTKTALGASVTLSGGKATFSTSNLAVGTNYVEALYAASGNYAASTSNVVSQVVNALGTTSSLTSTPNPSSFGSSVSFTDTVSASSGTPAGTVTFYSCTTSACSTKTALGASVTLSGGKATFSTSNLAVGTNYVEALYAASGNYAASTSNVVSQVVNALGTTSSLTSTPNPSSFGSSVSFTDTVSASSGTPAGTVTFYSCTTSACSTKTALGASVTLSGGKATFSTSNLAVGTNYVEALYAASGNYAASTSNVVSQVVNALGTTSSLTSTPNPSSFGSSVSFTDTVSASSGTPAGTVTFYSCTTSACSTKTALGASVTLSGGKATFSTSNLAVGTNYVEALYAASGNYAASTSNVVSQVVINVPAVCPNGGYSDYITGTSPPQFLYGTNGNDYISAAGGTFWIEGFSGNDCITVGDGNDDIYDGNGTNGVLGGNGSDDVFLGDGNNKVSLGNGSDWVQLGNGNDAVTLGNGWDSAVIVGNGNDSVSIGNGSYNEVYLGNGADTVTVQSQGSGDIINGGSGNETIYLGSGINNTYNGQAHHTNVCHLPAPPSSYHGSAAAYYHDTITNCTVVTP